MEAVSSLPAVWFWISWESNPWACIINRRHRFALWQKQDECDKWWLRRAYHLTSWLFFSIKKHTTRNNFQCLHSRATEENRLCRGPHSNFFFEAAVSECSTNIFKFISDLIYVNINCIKWHCQWRKESKSKQLYRECWHLRRSFYILYSMEYKYTTHLGCSSTA